MHCLISGHKKKDQKKNKKRQKKKRIKNKKKKKKKKIGQFIVPHILNLIFMAVFILSVTIIVVDLIHYRPSQSLYKNNRRLLTFN